jgi:hypothetical protein
MWLTIFGQALLLFLPNSIQFLQHRQTLNFLLHASNTGDSIVVRKGDYLQSTSFRGSQDIQIRNFRLPIVAGSRRVQMQIDYYPTTFLFQSRSPVAITANSL